MAGRMNKSELKEHLERVGKKAEARRIVTGIGAVGAALAVGFDPELAVVGGTGLLALDLINLGLETANRKTCEKRLKDLETK